MNAEIQVEVARDALAQVMCGAFRCEFGYFHRYSSTHCAGCALGSLLLGAIGTGLRRNIRAGSPWLMETEIRHKLRDVWSPSQIGAIEQAYENNIEWFSKFYNSRDRLIAILQNIVRNAGTFVPTDIRPIEPDSGPAAIDFKTTSIAVVEQKMAMEESCSA